MIEQVFPTYPADKLAITAHYDERTGVCTSIDVRINDDAGVSREDLTEIMALLFQPYGAASTGEPTVSEGLHAVPDDHPADSFDDPMKATTKRLHLS